jgi:Cof subfamily protein (haloacid dehalogenase superfamily)
MSLDTSPIRYIALDLDGTLLRTDKSVSARSRSAIQSAVEKGYKPIVATARPPRGAAALLKGYLADVPHIYYSGSRIVVGGNRLLNQTIPSEAALEIVNHFLDHAPDTTISVEIDDRFYSTHPHEHALPGDIIDVRDVLDREPIKIMLDMSDDLPPDILSHLPEEVRYVVSDAGTLAQISHADISKSDAIRRVVEAQGSDLSAVIAFGDDTNDVEMIRDAGIGVAMANAVYSVKAVAGHITLSNDEDGVAVTIEELLLN